MGAGNSILTPDSQKSHPGYARHRFQEYAGKFRQEDQTSPFKAWSKYVILLQLMDTLSTANKNQIVLDEI